MESSQKVMALQCRLIAFIWEKKLLMKEDHHSYRCNFCTCEKKAVTFVTNSNNKMSPKLNFFGLYVTMQSLLIIFNLL